MRIIKTLNDIQLLRKAQALDDGLLGELERKLREAHTNIKDGNTIEKFSLRQYGPLVVLEPGDNLADLEELGFNSEDGGLVGTTPEWVDLLDIAGNRYYDLVIVMNNEGATMGTVPVAGCYEPRVRQILFPATAARMATVPVIILG